MDHKQEVEIKLQSFRFVTLFLFVSLFFVILLARLFFLQIYQGERLKNFSDSNRFRKQLLIAPRGLILDRKGQVLAGNKKETQLIVHLTPDFPLEKNLQLVSNILQIPVTHLQKKIKKSIRQHGIHHPVVLKKTLSLMEIHKLKLLSWSQTHLQVRTVERRFYPLKENAAQIIGHIGPLSKKEVKNLKQKKQMFYLGDIVGKSGLEKFYDDHLKGKNGFSMVEVDARNRLAHSSDSPFQFFKIESQKGNDIILTLDASLQNFALQAIRRNDSIGPRTGAVIVMKTNGEILAMLSEPSFDINLFSSSVDLSVWKKWSVQNKIFINKALQEHYSPGSAFKPFLALAALQEGVIDRQTLIYSPGKFKVGKRFYHDHNPEGHGDINIIKALEKSSNTFFYQVADKIGMEALYKYAYMFGFGQKTKIKLPSESSGFLPSPAWKKKTYKEKWHRGDTMNIAIGQGGLISTLLQLTVAYNAIATQGLMVKPFLMAYDQNGKKTKPVILDSLTDRIKRSHFNTVKQGLRQVVEGEQGTARLHRLPFVSFSGKTGTAQVIAFSAKNIYKSCKKLPKQQKHHGLFIGFAPSDKPEIVTAVFTEHSCSGSSGSAPIAKNIIKYYMEQKKI